MSKGKFERHRRRNRAQTRAAAEIVAEDSVQRTQAENDIKEALLKQIRKIAHATLSESYESVLVKSVSIFPVEDKFVLHLAFDSKPFEGSSEAAEQKKADTAVKSLVKALKDETLQPASFRKSPTDHNSERSGTFTALSLEDLIVGVNQVLDPELQLSPETYTRSRRR